MILKKILIKLQLLKLLNEIKKNKNNKFSLWFYKIFIVFKYLNITKKKTKIKNIYNSFWINNIKNKNLKFIIKNNYKHIKLKNIWKTEKFDLKNIKLNFFIEKIYKKNYINNFYKIYYNYFYKIKKLLQNLFKNKFIINNKFIKKFIILKKHNISYKFVALLQNYIKSSKLKELNILKEKWNKKLSTNLNIRYWLKKNKKAIIIIKKIYKYFDLNKNIVKLSLNKNNKNILLLNNLNNFKDFSLLNYNILWKNKKDRRIKNFKLLNNMRSNNEYLYSLFLKKLNKKNFSSLNNLNKRKYSIFFYFLKYKDGFFLKNFKLNQIKKKINYLKNININNNNIINIKKKYQQEKQYKKNYRLKKENKLIINIFKEFIFGLYEEKSYYIFYKYLGTFKKEMPLNYKLKLTKTMKIKGDLWTAPCIIHYYDPVLIELRTLKMRINNFWMLENRHLKWKGNFLRFLSYKKKKQTKNLLYKQLNNEWNFTLKKIEKKINKKDKTEFLNNFIIQINDLKQSIMNVNSFRNVKTVNFYLKKTISNINKIDYFKKNNIKKITEKDVKKVKIKFELKSNQEKEIFYYLFLNNLLKTSNKINNKILYKIKLIELKERLQKSKEKNLIVNENNENDDKKKKKVKINKLELNKYIILKNYLIKIKNILKNKRKIRKLNSNIFNFLILKKKKKILFNINKYRKIKKLFKILNFIKVYKKKKLKILKRKKLMNLDKKYIKNFKNIEHALKILNLVRARKDNLNKRISMKLFLWNILKFKKEKKNLEKKKKKIIKIIKNKNMYNNIILQNYIIKYWYKKNLLLYIIINFFYKDFHNIGSTLKYKYNFVKSKYYLNWILWLKLWNYKRFKYINKKKKIRRINYITILNNIYKY